MRDWVVAGGLIERDGRVLLVQNRRRNGSLDWSPPGGVIEEAEGEQLIAGLTREVAEETGLIVTRWTGPVYEVAAEAPALGWRMRCEVHLAVEFEGELRVADPDGIVVDARFVAAGDCGDHLARCHQWVREPLAEWLVERWEPTAARPYGYRVDGTDPGSFVVTRL